MLRQQVKCEFCYKTIRGDMDATVCDKCDTKLAREQDLFMMKRTQAWSKKYQCQDCKAPLSLDRRFKCHKCRPSELVETEGLFDSAPDMDVA